MIPPDLIAVIRDSAPGDAWLPAISQLEDRIIAIKARGKVKASHEIGMVVEGLKAKVCYRPLGTFDRNLNILSTHAYRLFNRFVNSSFP